MVAPAPGHQSDQRRPQDRGTLDLQGTPAYPKHRRAIAALVREAENYLWPDAVTPERKAEIGGSEIVQVYPHRHSVPPDLWSRLLDQAEDHIEILVYVGMSSPKTPP